MPDRKPAFLAHAPDMHEDEDDKLLVRPTTRKEPHEEGRDQAIDDEDFCTSSSSETFLTGSGFSLTQHMILTCAVHRTTLRAHTAHHLHISSAGTPHCLKVKMAQGLGHDRGTSKLGREWRGLGRGWASVSQHDDQGKAGYPKSELDQEKKERSWSWCIGSVA